MLVLKIVELIFAQLDLAYGPAMVRTTSELESGTSIAMALKITFSIAGGVTIMQLVVIGSMVVVVSMVVVRSLHSVVVGI